MAIIKFDKGGFGGVGGVGGFDGVGGVGGFGGDDVRKAILVFCLLIISLSKWLLLDCSYYSFYYQTLESQMDRFN